MIEHERLPAAVDRCTTPPIPEGTRPLQHQVAGHVFGRANGHLKTNKLGFLQSDEGFILKPVQGPCKGDREVKFYQQVFSDDCIDPVLLSLQQFMPKYLGIWSTPVHPGQLYMKLEDVTYHMARPCVMDIKVGPVTYDRDADACKIAREKAKFPALPEVGFQLLGIRMYDPKLSSYRTIERTFLRALNKEKTQTKGLAAYFFADESFEPRLVQAFLRRLAKIEEWFLSQKSLSIIASSLLFIYDADAVRAGPKLQNGSVHVGNSYGGATELPDAAHECSRNEYILASSLLNSKCSQLCNGCEAKAANGLPPVDKTFTTSAQSSTVDTDEWFDRHIDVRMIDFTHVFPADSIDTNYLIGLRSLMQFLSELKAGTYDPSPDP